MPNKIKSTKRKKRSNTEKPTSSSAYIKTILKGSLIAVISFFALTLIMAVAVVKIGMGESIQSIAMFFVSALSAFIGGFFSLLKTREKGLISGILVSLPAALLISIVLICALKDIGLKTLAMVLSMAIGGAMGGITAVNKKRKH